MHHEKVFMSALRVFRNLACLKEDLMRNAIWTIPLGVMLLVACTASDPEEIASQPKSALIDCVKVAAKGLRPVAERREARFLGKVEEDTAVCRGGEKPVEYRGTPWVDWSNYWATGDASTLSKDSKKAGTAVGGHLVKNGRGIDGALLDLEYQRIELIKFNLFDNATYEQYLKGRDGVGGRALKVWPEMRLRAGHPDHQQVGGGGVQICRGDLIRNRTVTGICNDIKNPAMGSTNQLFARNVQFEETFPRLGRTELIRNRHGNRLGLLRPDPQVISRKLFTREQSAPEKCNHGLGVPGNGNEAHCDYRTASFFNVLAAFWIQFMTHDWFSHLDEGRNQPSRMALGCTMQRVNNEETRLTEAQQGKLGCRPQDRMEKALLAQEDEPPSVLHNGQRQLTRAPKTTRNTVTAWWDASQIYGYDERSRKRVKRDPRDRAKLLLVQRVPLRGKGDELGYLPLFETCSGNGSSRTCIRDPINPEWAGQEATAFPDNWSIGLSFYHNLFAREHNIIVDEFQKLAARMPDADSGLRHPDRPQRVITYKEVSSEELFEIARLIVSAEIAKIHTIEWTTQLLYNEPLYKGMNANWSGLVQKHEELASILEKIAVKTAKSKNEDITTAWYSVLASGPGIFGIGNKVYGKGLSKKKDVWNLSNADHVNGGVNHFGSPFNFPEEFVTVYRLHPLVPDLIEYREWNQGPNDIKEKIPVLSTFRGKATKAMRTGGLSNWALSMGRQRLGALSLRNHPQFLQNLSLGGPGRPGINQVDIAALDIIRDRERGVPRFNEFRRQLGLRQLTSFNDFIDKRLPEESAARQEQEELVRLLREVYGQHRCDAAKIITTAQLAADDSPINDCLGQANGSMVDNVEDLDNVVGWLAETTRPHGFAISETQFHVFIINASRRLFSDRFFTSSFRPEFYTHFGVDWVNRNGPGGKVMERGKPNGHEQEVSPLKRVLLRTTPELAPELDHVINVFDPWARDRGSYYSLKWQPRPGTEADKGFKPF